MILYLLIFTKIIYLLKLSFCKMISIRVNVNDIID